MHKKINVDYLKNKMPSVHLPKIRSRKIFFTKSAENVHEVSSQPNIDNPPIVHDYPRHFSTVVERSPSRISTISELVEGAPKYDYSFGGAKIPKAFLRRYRQKPEKETSKSATTSKRYVGDYVNDGVKRDDVCEEGSIKGSLRFSEKLTKHYKELSELRFKNIFGKKTIVKTTEIQVDVLKKTYEEEKQAEEEEEAEKYQRRRRSSSSNYEFEFHSLPVAVGKCNNSSFEDSENSYQLESKNYYNSTKIDDDDDFYPHHDSNIQRHQQHQQQGSKNTTGNDERNDESIKQNSSMLWKIRSLKNRKNRNNESLEKTDKEENRNFEKEKKSSIRRQAFDEACDKAKKSVEAKIQKIKLLKSSSGFKTPQNSIEENVETESSVPENKIDSRHKFNESKDFHSRMNEKSIKQHAKEQNGNRQQINQKRKFNWATRRYLSQSTDSNESVKLPDHILQQAAEEYRSGNNNNPNIKNPPIRPHPFAIPQNFPQFLPQAIPKSVVITRSAPQVPPHHHQQHQQQKILEIKNEAKSKIQNSSESPESIDVSTATNQRRSSQDFFKGHSRKLSLDSVDSDSWIPDNFKNSTKVQNPILNVIKENTSDQAWAVSSNNKSQDKKSQDKKSQDKKSQDKKSQIHKKLLTTQSKSVDIFKNDGNEKEFDDFEDVLKNEPVLQIDPKSTIEKVKPFKKEQKDPSGSEITNPDMENVSVTKLISKFNSSNEQTKAQERPTGNENRDRSFPEKIQVKAIVETPRIYSSPPTSPPPPPPISASTLYSTSDNFSYKTVVQLKVPQRPNLVNNKKTTLKEETNLQTKQISNKNIELKKLSEESKNGNFKEETISLKTNNDSTKMQQTDNSGLTRSKASMDLSSIVKENEDIFYSFDCEDAEIAEGDDESTINNNNSNVLTKKVYKIDL